MADECSNGEALRVDEIIQIGGEFSQSVFWLNFLHDYSQLTNLRDKSEIAYVYEVRYPEKFETYSDMINYVEEIGAHDSNFLEYLKHKLFSTKCAPVVGRKYIDEVHEQYLQEQDIISTEAEIEQYYKLSELFDSSDEEFSIASTPDEVEPVDCDQSDVSEQPLVPKSNSFRYTLGPIGYEPKEPAPKRLSSCEVLKIGDELSRNLGWRAYLERLVTNKISKKEFYNRNEIEDLYVNTYLAPFKTDKELSSYLAEIGATEDRFLESLLRIMEHGYMSRQYVDTYCESCSNLRLNGKNSSTLRRPDEENSFY